MKKIFAFLTALICCLSMWSFVPAAQSLTLDKEDGEYSIQVDLEEEVERQVLLLRLLSL